MTIGLNLSFRLQTHVHDGLVFIVAIDKYGREQFQVQMRPNSIRGAAAVAAENEDGSTAILMEHKNEFKNYRMNQWHSVDQHSDDKDDDITSNGNS